MEDFSIEKGIERLEEISKILEDKDTTLKDSMTVYQEGVLLIKKCKDELSDVEKEMIILGSDKED